MTELLFAGPDGSLSQFPDEHQLRSLGSKASPVHLDAFITMAWRATRRFWVLDYRFCPLGFHGTEGVLMGAKVADIRIISDPAPNKLLQEEQLRRVVDRAWNTGGFGDGPKTAPVAFEWRDRLRRKGFPFPHDRFVILDDSLWHFGVASCGSSNHLSAASGPWPAPALGAISFFEALWTRMDHG